MIKRASQFSVPQSWKVLLNDMDIDPQLVLVYAKLPADSFIRAYSTWRESPWALSRPASLSTKRIERKSAEHVGAFLNGAFVHTPFKFCFLHNQSYFTKC